MATTDATRAAMMTYSGVAVPSRQVGRARVWSCMFVARSSFLGLCIGAALAFAPVTGASAQNAEQRPPEQAQKPPAAPPADASKEDKKRVDEYAEAARILSGPAGYPECVWLGRRVVNWLFRDDLDTALRQLELYDRFGCPADHLQQAFRCVVRQGEIDKKSPESIGIRVTACWLTSTTPPVLATPATGTPLPPSSE
ncbi:MAG TPA: beta-1-3, beta-1-6-glucan biosynthesis protein [Xanthobacteraceae bacterium]|nr:beta-1-3, beta-1-6-glucan biosynthesis protein [Xanthobacteraceae bacterium]